MTDSIHIAGFVVALQWPRPHFLCYRTPRSDLPTGRGCCSLYRMNCGCGALWLALTVIMIVSHSLARTIVGLSFCVLHWTAILLFQQRFRKFGFPTWQDMPPVVVSTTNCLPLLQRPQPSSVHASIYMHTTPAEQSLLFYEWSRSAFNIAPCGNAACPSHMLTNLLRNKATQNPMQGLQLPACTCAYE